jgi:hypothetical protein
MNWLTTFVLAQDDSGSAAAQMVILVIYLAIVVLIVAGLWKIFTKAGKPGWASIIPIYNGIVLLEIAGKPIWWIILFLIPCVQIVMAILTWMAVAKNFGKSELYGIGLAFLPFIFIPLLGFSDAKYRPVSG